MYIILANVFRQVQLEIHQTTYDSCPDQKVSSVEDMKFRDYFMGTGKTFADRCQPKGFLMYPSYKYMYIHLDSLPLNFECASRYAVTCQVAQL